MPIESNATRARAGFECVEFTKDGGFIVGGFHDRFNSNNIPTFKVESR